MEHALVTGGAGFIGSHLADRLLEDGVEVTAVDNLSTGDAHSVSHLREEDGFELIEADISEHELDELAQSVDVIFHLAAAVGVEQIVDNPVETIRTKIDGTERALDVAVNNDFDFLLASTSEVYGKSSTFPFAESDDLVLGPPSSSRWCYAASKIIDEHLSMAYAQQWELMPRTVS